MVADRTPNGAWQYMLECNRRFAENRSLPQNLITLGWGGIDLATEQRPLAALVSCSDSRIPAEIIFNVGIGDLFVIRNAGHIPSISVRASLEYAVQTLRVPLVVFMAHADCAVLRAALDPSGALPPSMLDMIEPLVTALGKETDLKTARHLHLKHTIERVLKKSEVLALAVAEGRLGIVGAEYLLTEGNVSEIFTLGPIVRKSGGQADAST